MTRTEAQLKTFAEIWALVLTPVALILGYQFAGHAAALNFRILDPASDLIEGIAVAAILLFSIQLWPVPESHRRALTLLWIIRIGIALGFMLFYEAFYRLDASIYYGIGTNLNDPFKWFSFGNGTFNMFGVVALITKVTESYSAMKVLFSYVGLIAIYVFYRAAVVALQRDAIALLYILGMFPSVLFWSSILGKDPITLLGVAVFSYGVAGLISGRGPRMVIFIGLGLLIASFIRIWLGAIFLAPLLTAVVLGGRLSITLKACFLMLAIPMFMTLLQTFAEQFSLETAADLVTRTDQISQSWAHGGSAQRIEGGFNSIIDMLLFMPIGAFTALFRPLPGEILNAFGFMAGLENAFILGLVVNGIMRRGLAWLRHPLLLWAALTLLAWSAVYGFASYQNLGTAFRFHVQVAPILLIIGLYLSFLSAAELPRRSFRLVEVGGTARATDGD